MERYIDLTLDLHLLHDKQVDLRVPSTMTLKEMLQLVLDSYKIEQELINPTAYVIQTGQIVYSTSLLKTLKDGTLLTLETR